MTLSSKNSVSPLFLGQCHAPTLSPINSLIPAIKIRGNLTCFRPDTIVLKINGYSSAVPKRGTASNSIEKWGTYQFLGETWEWWTIMHIKCTMDPCLLSLVAENPSSYAPSFLYNLHSIPLLTLCRSQFLIPNMPTKARSIMPTISPSSSKSVLLVSEFRSMSHIIPLTSLASSLKKWHPLLLLIVFATFVVTMVLSIWLSFL